MVAQTVFVRITMQWLVRFCGDRWTEWRNVKPQLGTTYSTTTHSTQHIISEHSTAQHNTIQYVVFILELCWQFSTILFVTFHHWIFWILLPWHSQGFLRWFYFCLFFIVLQWVLQTVYWKVLGYFTMIFHICVTRFHDSMGYDMSITIRFT